MMMTTANSKNNWRYRSRKTMAYKSGFVLCECVCLGYILMAHLFLFSHSPALLGCLVRFFHRRWQCFIIHIILWKRRGVFGVCSVHVQSRLSDSILVCSSSSSRINEQSNFSVRPKNSFLYLSFGWLVSGNVLGPRAGARSRSRESERQIAYQNAMMIIKKHTLHHHHHRTE